MQQSIIQLVLRTYQCKCKCKNNYSSSSNFLCGRLRAISLSFSPAGPLQCSAVLPGLGFVSQCLALAASRIPLCLCGWGVDQTVCCGSSRRCSICMISIHHLSFLLTWCGYGGIMPSSHKPCMILRKGNLNPRYQRKGHELWQGWALRPTLFSWRLMVNPAGRPQYYCNASWERSCSACHATQGTAFSSYSFLVCLKMIGKAIDENLVFFPTILYLARS